MNKKIKEIIEALEFMCKTGDVSKIALESLKNGLEELDEQLNLSGVSQQREQLLAYHNHLDSFNDPSIYNAPENMIDDYLANNCG